MKIEIALSALVIPFSIRLDYGKITTTRSFAQKVGSQRLRRRDVRRGFAAPKRSFLHWGCAPRSTFGPKTLCQGPNQRRSRGVKGSLNGEA